MGERKEKIVRLFGAVQAPFPTPSTGPRGGKGIKRLELEISLEIDHGAIAHWRVQKVSRPFPSASRRSPPPPSEGPGVYRGHVRMQIDHRSRRERKVKKHPRANALFRTRRTLLDSDVYVCLDRSRWLATIFPPGWGVWGPGKSP
ncbi:sodium/hydrogen exchanger 3 [Anopheles sinensis]|uniref:Sodium/hydrogen exchanger 3 n=1 Tax=Anopheles sinensis TaxID=74873 RepID=A0A084W770_ANOSI|nr:sodium/hydrogen exchanger 3 [Anopheles sinensis]